MNILSEYRKSKKITQAKLGELLNVKQAQVSKMCKNGIDNRTTRILRKISALLGKSIDEVVYGMRKHAANDNAGPDDKGAA
jgi:transcriptional regulator with XRE-family HTH domain